MPDPFPSSITGAFHRPFDEQLAFFRAKMANLIPTTSWRDVSKAGHDTGFMIAGATKADFLQDMASAVERTMAEGKSFDAFYKDFEAMAAKHGWTGWTGEGTPTGRRWRARVIYQTNAQVAYSAGRLAQLRAGKFPFWVYHHAVGEMRPRPLHVSWDGLVLAPDHAFWKKHYPPSAWGCRCYVTGARSEKGARRMGGDPDKKLSSDWDEIDPVTGEPPGIDEGWGYMPGDTVHKTVREMASKIQRWDYSLAKSYMQSVPKDARDALSTAYRGLPSTADDARRYAQRVINDTVPESLSPYRTLGLLTTKQAERINQLQRSLEVENFDFSLDPAGIKHTHNRHPAISIDDYTKLPQLLNAGDTIVRYVWLRDMRLPGVEFTTLIDGKKYVTVWGIRVRRKMLTLHTFYLKEP